MTKKLTKIEHFSQDGQLPVGFRVWVQMAILCVWIWYINLPSFILLRQSRRLRFNFEIFKGALQSHFATPIFKNHKISNFSPRLACFGGFGKAQTMWSQVMRVWNFMARHRNSPCHHGNQEWRKKKILITFHLQCLKMFLNKFEVGQMKSLELVH